MVELVVTMIIIGVLAVAVIPRFNATQELDRRRFHDETKAALQFAQKTAIAQHRNVCATFAAGSVALTVALASGNAEACGPALRNPSTNAPYVVNAPAGVTYTTVPGALTFNALGQASAARVISVADFAPHSITVVQETGYVRP